VHDLTLLIVPVAVALRLRPSWDRALPRVLTLGYCAVVVGLALVTVIPVQLSVVAMSCLGAWFAFQMSGREMRTAVMAV
jgi:ABC-type Mn2+/Zn2+ transport system permease subunit